MRRATIRSLGFTLVELLVVIGIIAVLVSILLPALKMARDAAYATRCLANLKQLNMALIMYADTNHQFLPPTSGGTQIMPINGVATSVAVRWYGGAIGSVTTGTFYPPAGILYPYLGMDSNIGGCPSFADMQVVLRPGYGTTDYAYSDWCGRGPSGTGTGTGMKMSIFRNPSEKAVFWDAARILPPSIMLDRTPWGYPTSGNPNTGLPDPNFHGRHSGHGNVAWLDGHCSAVAPYYFTAYPAASNLNPTLLRKNNIGNIDDDGSLTTDEHYSPYVD